MEILENGTGNGDGLCESGETCVYFPNFGAHQGEASLVGPCVFHDGTVAGVKIFSYSVNGR